MWEYQKFNNLTGWALFVISTTVYILTLEPTASYWDCGEFIAVSYKLEVPHPPGAPMFLLIGRMFSFLALGDVTQVAYWINMISALSSGFTILFLFWTITLLGRKFFSIKSGKETLEQTLLLMSAGTIGALAYTFSDSFWFSAVEAEVYAMSSFFTAFVVWAILKWDVMDDEQQANKWLIFIAYMMGLSIGVHLLNLVCIPALGLIYYFKKQPNPNKRGIIATLLISAVIIMIITSGIITGLPVIAGSFEIFFVNSLGLPFGSGMVFFTLLFVGAIVYGIIYSHKKQKVLLNTAILCFAFINISYSCYALVLIRSNFNPPIDENNPENIISFVSYLKREQYGALPSMLYGPFFSADRIGTEQGDPVYTRVGDKYKITDYKLEPVYDPKGMTVFPRAWSDDPKYEPEYRRWMGLKPGQKPTFVDNLEYLFKYQVGHSYLRYFMWNFAGRESDIQNAGWLGPFDSTKDLPDLLANNKGRNNFYLLPLILGIAGLFYQYNRNSKNFAVVGMLFLLTGLAVVVYLNIPATQPRERDYIYVGSFYAFCIWIGFGTMALYSFVQRYIKNKINAVIITFTTCLAVPIIMAAEGWDDHDRSNRYFSVDSAKNFLASCAPNAILFTGGDNDTFPLWYVQEVEGFRTDVRVIVQSYFNTDWYIDQMTRPAYESHPLPFSLTLENFKQGGPNDYLPLVANPNLKGPIDSRQYINLIKNNHPALQRPAMSGTVINIVPGKTFALDINKQQVLDKGIIPEKLKSKVVNRMTWNMKGGYLGKADLMTLDLIVSNNWERPIYFNNTSLQGVNFDLRKYVVQEGVTYRLLPIENDDLEQEMVNTEVMYDNMMNNFHWRSLNDPDVYFSTDYRSFVLNHRSSFNTLAMALIKEGSIDKAREVLLKSIELMPDEGVPYDYFNAQTLNLLIRSGETEKAVEMAEILGERANQMLAYLSKNNINNSFEARNNLITLNEIVRSLKNAGEDESAAKYEESFTEYLNLVR